MVNLKISVFKGMSCREVYGDGDENEFLDDVALLGLGAVAVFRRKR